MPRLRRKEAERRQHRRRLVFASAGEGVGYPQTPQVQILLSNGTWLDISSDVRYSQKIRTRRGRSATDSHVRAGDASLRINNLDGKYSPRNPRSVLYGLIGRNTQLRISRLGSLRFWGEVPEWPSEWTTGGQDAWVNLVVAGILRRLLAPKAPVLQSSMRRAVLYSTTQPVGYWALEGGDSTTIQAFDSIGNYPTENVDQSAAVSGEVGAPSFGTADIGPGSDKVVNIAGHWTLGMPLPLTGIASTGAISVQWAQMYGTEVRTGGFVNVGFRLNPTTAATHLTWQMDVNDDGTGHLDVIEANNLLVATAGPTTVATFSVTNMYNGVAKALQLDLSTGTGNNVNFVLWLDGLLLATGSYAASFAGAMNAPPYRLSTFAFGIDASATVGFGHGTIYNVLVTADRSSALLGHPGEVAGRRIQRLLGEASYPFVSIGNLDDTMPMAPQGMSRLIDLLYDGEDADMGFLFEDRNSFSIGYRTRSSMFSQSAILGLDYTASGNITLPLKPTDNDQRVINDSSVSRPGGTVPQRYALTSGPMSTADPSEGGIGSYPEGPTVNVNTDLNAADIAGWHVNVGTVDEQRFDQVNVNVANTISNHGLISLAGQMTYVDMGDRISIDNPPIWTSVDQINLIMVGEVEEFDQFEYTIAYDTISQTPYQIGILDDIVLGRAESDGTRTVNSHISTDTVFSVSTDTGELWLTTATLPADFPFDIMCMGERATVTDITGTSNPQVWTFIRGVNGISVNWPAGSPITLRHKFRLG